MSVRRTLTAKEWALGGLLFLVQGTLGRGGGGIRRYQTGEEPTRTYPSEVRRYYYEYYIKYFSYSSFRYVQRGRANARTVSVCNNYEDFYGNGTVLGVFPCPMENDPDQFTECCGDNNYEYCCRLIDTTDFRLKVGLGGALGLSLLVGIIVFAFLKIRGGAKKIAKRSDNQRSNFKAIQTDDGYQILVHFKKTKFYDRLWKALCSHYVHLAWKYRDGGAVKEGKVTLAESSWVTLVLCDDVRGSPMMVVSREKSAVEWMEGPFIDICNELSDGSGGCFSCFKGRKQKNKVCPTEDRAEEKKDEQAPPEKEKKECKRKESDKRTDQKKEAISVISDNRHLPMY